MSDKEARFWAAPSPRLFVRHAQCQPCQIGGRGASDLDILPMKIIVDIKSRSRIPRIQPFMDFGMAIGKTDATSIIVKTPRQFSKSCAVCIQPVCFAGVNI